MALLSPVAADPISPPAAPTFSKFTVFDTAEEVRWPVAGFVHRLPDIPNPNWAPGHRGIDISMPYTSDVYSPVSGVVSWVGTISDLAGITIQSGMGFKHTLFPIATQLVEGEMVQAGELLGQLSEDLNDHCGFTKCVHWGVRDGTQYLDPRWLVPALLYELP
jgi:murein DD-endopeptidase MepM/ murein hydrolase activator NlpD